MCPTLRPSCSGRGGHSNIHATNPFYMRWFVYSVFILFFGTKVSAQVNPQNGAAQINIPLYSYSDAGNRLGLNASLVYVDGNGLKVSEVASPVGTGWVLDCGGVITRIQHGEPDDQEQNGTFGYNETLAAYLNYMDNYYPDGYLHTSFSPADAVDNLGGYEVYQQSLPSGSLLGGPGTYKLPRKYLADREQDVFAFTFNGRSGKFVIGKDRSVKTLIDSKLKITFQESDMHSTGVRTTISQFTITDESGIQYVFKDLELSYVCTYNDFRRISADNQNITTTTSSYYPQGSYLANQTVVSLAMGRPTSQYVVSKWYLSQIINPLTNKSILFTYDSYEQEMDGDILITNVSFSTQTGTETNAMWQKIKAKAKRLKSVALSNAEKLDFSYYSGTRVDQPTENALSALNVSYNGNLIYSWKFGLGYFLGKQFLIRDITDTHIYTDEEKHWARLALLTLQKVGTNNAAEPAYRFTYDMGDPTQTIREDYIPPQFSIHKDHFGYYAPWEFYGVSEGYATSFYPISEIRSAAATTGGNLNDAPAHNPLQIRAKDGIIKSIAYPMGGTLSFTYEANNTPSMQLGGVRVATATQYDGIDHANDIIRQYKYIMPDGSSSGWGGETYTYGNTYAITATNCGGSSPPGAQSKQFAMSLVMQMFPGSAMFEQMASFKGLSGNALDYIFMGLNGGVYNSSGNPTDYTVTAKYNFNATLANPLPWGYARTEVITLLSASNVGKTVYEFSSPADRPIDVPSVSVHNSSRPRYAPWVYGLPETITVLDKDGLKVKQTVNHYQFTVNATADPNFLSRSWAAIKKEYACDLIAFSFGYYDMISQESYYPLTGHTALTSTDEKTFNSAQSQTTATSYYEYDQNFQLKHQYTFNSKGEKIDKYFYHPYDYASVSPVFSTMSASNVVEPVLSTENYITKADGNMYMTSAVSTDFGFIANGDIKPRALYSFQSVQPLSKNALQPFNVNSVVRDPAYFKQTALFDYDVNGNVVQSLTGGNKVLSAIYDYDGRISTATVSNASFNDIGYSSFEAEGGKSGSWVNTAAIINDDARTGNHSFNLSDPSNSNLTTGNFGFGGLNSGLTYIVSFWGKNGSACVNGYAGATNTVSTCQGGSGWTPGATVNGWTYYEVKVSGVDKVSMSGTGLVDEFRLYPAGAQMKTTTYAPLIGKTSECDASGRVVYYLYDDLGRLIKVSDDQRNVIRTYEYNYKQ